MNVLQTNVSLARTPEVAALAALQVGQADLVQREDAVNAGREAQRRQAQVAGAEGGAAAAATDADHGGQQQEPGRRPPRPLTAAAPSPPASPRPLSLSPAGVGTRLDVVV